ncbi:PAS domain-containing response regulator [Haloarcula salina]|uniref:PAS domain S-box protein n=1 Tax=Haloarcula salina TaxID=1429914 RepID=A0AA41FZ48_9EURY|nr:PAS domain S-box protein [Haloarcula salina]MBV0901230.1 PAS domain S-box protein [Haloarcula salina]
MGDEVSVLHVDDDPDLADVTATFLQRTDDRFDVETAARAAPVLDRALDDSYDCIVSDYDMPEMDGLEFLRAVRDRSPKLPFILYTGKGSEEIAADAISAGVTDYIQKKTGTVQYAILANRIRNAVEARRNERQVVRDYHAMDAAWDGIGTIDAEGRFTYVNESYAETVGYDREELEGSPWQMVYSEAGREVVEDEILPAVRENGTWTGETRLRRADGTEFVGEHTVGDIDGDGAVCVLRNRTEREELDTQLRHERERFRLLVDAVEEYAMFVLDPDGRIRSWNAGAERITGYGEAEVVDEPLSTFHTAEQIEAGLADDLLEAAAEAGQATDQGLRVRKDGSAYWADVTITALRDDDALRGFAVVTRDISDRIDREHRQARTERYREDLYALTTDAERPFERRVVDVLDLGVDYLGLEDGCLLSLDPADGSHEILATSTDPTLVEPGTDSAVAAYARRTVESDGLLTAFNADDPDRTEASARESYGFGCYLGAALESDGDRFGAVCFVGREPQSEPFGTDEKTAVELLARWLTHELDRRGEHDQLSLVS